MCGIAGWVDHRVAARWHRDRLRDMTETMRCRGPDAEGGWCDGPVALGHRRLAVIDIAGGAQPMLDEQAEDTRFALTYSGELYNYLELRAELRALGHRFRTGSDTEVVLRAWRQWGPGSVARFNGMYAFAVWDRDEQDLWLVRDRLGVKPLYYHPTAAGAVFGSEPKALFAHGTPRPELDEPGLAQLLLPLLKIPGDTPYRGMREVAPGHMVRIGRDAVQDLTYWRLEAREHRDDWPTTVATVQELLTDAVRRQLVADVDVGTLLSGGLDSTALTGWARRFVPGALRSYSVDFTASTGSTADGGGRPGTQDAPYVDEAARHIGSAHRTITLDGKELADPALRDACVRARDLPVGIGDLDLSLYRLFQAVSEHSTVALSGESADEVFGGYRWFHEPGAVHAPTFPWLADSPAHGHLHQRITGFFRPELLRRLRPDEVVRDEYTRALAEVAPWPGADPVEARMREIGHLALTRFLPTLLDRKDRMSMAVGLEVRVPFCDHRLVEYLHAVPWAWKARAGEEKAVLRSAAAGVVPESIRRRVKVPYPSTGEVEYARSVHEHLREVASSPADGLDEFFDLPALTAATHGAAAGSLISNVGVELALNFDSWLRLHRPTF